MGDYVYVELALQTAAIRWLTEHWGYSEALSGEPSNNDRFDSVGVMDGRAVLIEVKPKVIVGMAYHSPQRPGSIESKISGVLRAVHEGRRNPLSQAVRTCWDRTQPLVVAILAGDYSEAGRAELIEMLQRRSREWLFDYRVWQWTGSEVEELARGDLKPPPRTADYDALKMLCYWRTQPESRACRQMTHQDRAVRTWRRSGQYRTWPGAKASRSALLRHAFLVQKSAPAPLNCGNAVPANALGACQKRNARTERRVHGRPAEAMGKAPQLERSDTLACHPSQAARPVLQGAAVGCVLSSATR